MTEDRLLVAAALEVGPEAYAPIIERYKDTLFGVAMGRLGHFYDAEDITQSVLVEGWERLGDLRDPARLNRGCGRSPCTDASTWCGAMDASPSMHRRGPAEILTPRRRQAWRTRRRQSRMQPWSVPKPVARCS